jgi:hypothetical protein
VAKISDEPSSNTINNHSQRNGLNKSFAFLNAGGAGETSADHKRRSAFIHAKLSALQQPKQFTLFVVVISLLTGLLSLPYVLLDYFYYKDALLVDVLRRGFDHHHHNRQHLNATSTGGFDFTKFLLQAPIVLINVPHAIKFYLLFAFYGKFRVQLGRFLKIRLYVDKKLARRLSQQKSPISSIKFIIVHNFSLVRCCCCCLFPASYTAVSTLNPAEQGDEQSSCGRNWLRRIVIRYCLGRFFNTRKRLSVRGGRGVVGAVPIDADRARINRMLRKMQRADEYDDETSSIVGFKAVNNGASVLELSMVNLYEQPHVAVVTPTSAMPARPFEVVKGEAKMPLVPACLMGMASAAAVVLPHTSNSKQVSFPPGDSDSFSKQQLGQQRFQAERGSSYERSSFSTGTVVLQPRNPLVFE